MTNQNEDQDNDASKPVNHKLVTIAAYKFSFSTPDWPSPCKTMTFKNISGVHGFVSFTVNVLIESLGFLNKLGFTVETQIYHFNIPLLLPVRCKVRRFIRSPSAKMSSPVTRL